MYTQTSWLYRIVDHPLFTSILYQLKVMGGGEREREKEGWKEIVKGKERERGGGRKKKKVKLTDIIIS